MTKTIPQLTAGAAPDGTEVFETVQGGVSVKLTLDELFTRAVDDSINIAVTGNGSVNILSEGGLAIANSLGGISLNTADTAALQIDAGEFILVTRNPSGVAIDVVGGGEITLQVGVGKLIHLDAAAWSARGVTVANLPAAATAGVGGRAFVTDASTTIILGIGTTVVGGGVNKVPVYSDGAAWKIG